MADYLLDIFEAIDARMTTYMATGQTLEDIKTCLVMYDQNEIPPEFGSYPPLCLIEQVGDMESEIMCIPATTSSHRFQVRWQVFTERANYDIDHKAGELVELLIGVFHQWQLGIDQLLVSAPRTKLRIPVREEFAKTCGGGAEMIIEYEYQDVRALPTS